MGYLDNSSITVDAILTKKGRELLAKGKSNFRITQFALADDDVDYDLWNPAHPKGSDYYGIVIESMPITEAVPDETQSMKYKLITLPRSSTAIPLVVVDKTEVRLPTNESDSNQANVTPITRYNGTNLNQASLNSQLGYTATLLDSTYATIRAIPGGATTSNMASDNETANSMTAVGFAFRVQPKGTPIASNKTTKLVITANETGGRVVIPVIIEPANDRQA